MTSNNHQEDSLKAAKRAEIERLWFNQEATNKELLEAYKALDVKEDEGRCTDYLNSKFHKFHDQRVKEDIKREGDLDKLFEGL